MAEFYRSFALAALALAVQGAAAGAEPLARFGIVSDVHILPSDAHRTDVFRRALELMDARKVDGVVACGDLTQNGTIEELRLFASTWYSVFPGDRRSDGEHVEKLFVYGDHDTEASFSPYYMRVCREKGIDMYDWLRKRGDIVLNDRAVQWKAAFHEDFAPIMRKRASISSSPIS